MIIWSCGVSVGQYAILLMGSHGWLELQSSHLYFFISQKGGWLCTHISPFSHFHTPTWLVLASVYVVADRPSAMFEWLCGGGIFFLSNAADGLQKSGDFWWISVSGWSLLRFVRGAGRWSAAFA